MDDNHNDEQFALDLTHVATPAEAATENPIQEARRQFRPFGSRAIGIVFEIFSVLTVLSFALSAAMHEAVFQTRGMSFLEVASTEDIVRQGLAALVTMLCYMLVFMIAGLVIVFLIAIFDGGARDLLQNALPFTFMLVLTVCLLTAPWPPTPVPSWRTLTNFGLMLPPAALIFVLRMQIQHLWQHSKLASWKEIGSNLREVQRAMWRPLLYSVIPAAVIVAGLSTIQRLGIMATDGAGFVRSVNGQDVGGRYFVPKLIWAGSQAAIVRCGGQTFIVRGAQDLVVRRNDPEPSKTSVLGRIYREIAGQQESPKQIQAVRAPARHRNVDNFCFPPARERQKVFSLEEVTASELAPKSPLAPPANASAPQPR
ncbi:hypothetical protein [Sphingomonas sp. G-3-2-10]|uniref:hypothetical protein n=1 Tax=Sphingomonas sp. G-3-2-10 TaxID=2728838 RepID=UPI00146C0791|nr:hypothetical protein [Sphingomonas sp. G-3-2-10]NML04537.1 hypothetical protein [Sphingomonas sp. G-3-2-10]